MSNEIEKKFKVKRLPKELLETARLSELTQTYINLPNVNGECRVRSIDNKIFKFTLKRPVSEDGLIREEIEEEISREDYELFLHNQIGDTIKKSRYEISAENDLNYELDIYHDNLEGLMVVEVEFANEELANNFVKPDWFGREVTDNKEYKNSSLAKKGLPKDYIAH